MTYKTSAGVKTKEVVYRYDVENRRTAKDVDDDGNGTADRGEWYVYDGQHILFRTDRNGTVTNRYLHGPDIDQVFADQSTADGLLWALSDNQGTVRDWADYASGTNTTAIVDHVKYDSFGKITAQSSGTHKPLFAYTGREWDADAGMYYYRARWYDSSTGRFIAEDPLGFAAGDENLQRYVSNSPLMSTDPTGLQEEQNSSPVTIGISPRFDPTKLFEGSGVSDVVQVDASGRLRLSRPRTYVEVGVDVRDVTGDAAFSGYLGVGVNGRYGNGTVRGVYDESGKMTGLVIYEPPPWRQYQPRAELRYDPRPLRVSGTASVGIPLYSGDRESGRLPVFVQPYYTYDVITKERESGIRVPFSF